MDAGQFDRLSRALGRGVTRRTLGSLVGGLGLGSFLLAGLDLAQAKKGKNEKEAVLQVHRVCPLPARTLSPGT